MDLCINGKPVTASGIDAERMRAIILNSSAARMQRDGRVYPLTLINHPDKGAIIRADQTTTVTNHFVDVEYPHLFDIRTVDGLPPNVPVTIRCSDIADLEFHAGPFATEQGIQPVTETVETIVMSTYNMTMTFKIDIDDNSLQAAQVEIIRKLLPGVSTSVLKLMFKNLIAAVMKNQYELANNMYGFYTPGEFGLFGVDPRTNSAIATLLSERNRIRGVSNAPCSLTGPCEVIYVPTLTNIMQPGTNYRKDPAPENNLIKYNEFVNDGGKRTKFRIIDARMMLQLTRDIKIYLGMFTQYLRKDYTALCDINNGIGIKTSDVTYDIHKVLNDQRLKNTLEEIYKSFLRVVIGGNIEDIAIDDFLNRCTDVNVTNCVNILNQNKSDTASTLNTNLVMDGKIVHNNFFDRLFLNQQMFDNIRVVLLREVYSLPVFGVTEKIVSIIHSNGSFQDTVIPVNNTQSTVATSINMGMNMTPKNLLTLPHACLFPRNGAMGLDNREETINHEIRNQSATPMCAVLFEITGEDAKPNIIDLGRELENAHDPRTEYKIDGRTLVSLTKLQEEENRLGYYHNSVVFVVKIGVPGMDTTQAVNMAVRKAIRDDFALMHIKESLPILSDSPTLIDVVLPASTADTRYPVMSSISGFSNSLRSNPFVK